MFISIKEDKVLITIFNYSVFKEQSCKRKSFALLSQKGAFYKQLFEQRTI